MVPNGQVGNSICDFINMEIDYHSKNHKNKIPVLRQLCTDNERIGNARLQQESVFIVQEVIRFLRNASRLLPSEVKTTPLSEVIFRMKDSGYSKSFILEIITNRVTGFQTRVSGGQADMYAWSQALGV